MAPSFLRQLSNRETRTSSKRWSRNANQPQNYINNNSNSNNQHQMLQGVRKRVMVVVDDTSNSKHAMMWALTHVTNKADFLTLLCVHNLDDEDHNAAHGHGHGHGHHLSASQLVNSLGALCKASKPEVEVEALVIQGPRLATVLSQVKKLEVSVLVLGQAKSHPFINCLCGGSRSSEFVEDCINGADCLTIGVRKQSKGVSGYLISTRWQKNFWLLA